MTHRLCVAPSQLEGDRVRFTAEQWHQLHSVLRMGTGASVRVFDGMEGVDHVVRIVEAGVGVLEGEASQAREPRTRVVAYPALLQRDKFETVLQKLTEVGATAIVPVITARSLVRKPPDARRQQRWRAILREATEQSRRGVVPELCEALSFADAVTQADGECIVAYEGGRDLDLRTALGARPSAVSLFVGPEGGYASDEVACARAAGAKLVTLGPRILRTETASPLLAALVLYELGDLSSPHDD